MKLISAAVVTIVIFSIFSGVSAAQDSGPVPHMGSEPHHSLLLKNERVRVFRLRLRPREVTLPHRHDAFYCFVSLTPITISHEVRGRKPVLTHMDALELHTSRGGFTVAERNSSADDAELIVIEPRKSNAGTFDGPTVPAGFRYTPFADLFVYGEVRAYSLMLPVEGGTDSRTEDHDRLMVALTDLDLLNTVSNSGITELIMKAGEVRWLPRGEQHSIKNLGSTPAKYLIVEFK